MSDDAYSPAWQWRGRSEATPSTQGKFVAVWSADDRCLGSVMRDGTRFEAFNAAGKLISVHASLETARAAVLRAAP